VTLTGRGPPTAPRDLLPPLQLPVDDVEPGDGHRVVAVGQQASPDHAHAIVAQTGEDVPLALDGLAHHVGHDLGIGSLCHGAHGAGHE